MILSISNPISNWNIFQKEWNANKKVYQFDMVFVCNIVLFSNYEYLSNPTTDVTGMNILIPIG